MTTSTEVVQLSYWNFAVWWVIILVIHVVTGVYTALYAYCYFMLQDIYLNSYLESFQIGMPPLYHHAIAITHVTMSALHAMCIFLMLGGSLWQRSLAFTPWSSCNAETKRDKVETSRTNSMLLQSFTKVYSTISDRPISGKKDEVEVKWGEFDSSTVVQLLIRHCPSLQVPDSISEFHGLHGIKVYNSTIVDWGESAALSNTNHPDIMSLYLARVNMTDGVLSKGFQSIDFPQNLNDIEFCVTNLHAVPDDLDIKWHKNALIQIEFSQLAFVPPVLLRLEPKYLALSGNQITDIPPEIFAIPTLSTLGLGLLNIQELPRNVTNLSPTLIAVFIDGTNISFFWPWVDKLITSEGWGVLLATDSPYCVDLVKIQDGTANAFSVPEYASILMDPSEANSPAIMYTVGCFGDVLPYYFIGLDDENMAISTPPPLVNPTAAKM
ncbi:hypothetical protein PR003_g10947 [Phytophthora rubi]|uniref:Uncharacterized protein n=1 Tax=Phytophthora rubi TaxID=129364 RepID=A0A6A4FC52_9STRA|nr:hypothetical protein PR003_g10947 [Phytophthora rubi]